MRPEVKLSDFYYKEPPVLTPDCLEEMHLASQAKESSAMKLWEEKYRSEIRAQRDTCLENVSNYAFMISLLGTDKHDRAEKALETYFMKPGFIRSGEVWGIQREYICNYEKALAVVEKKALKEFNEKPVYGGAYDN